MSYQYGFLKKQSNNTSFKAIGELKAPFFKGAIFLVEVQFRESDKAPNFYILDNNEAPIGKAWIKKPDDSQYPEFLSIEIDLPELDKPVYLTAWESKNDATLFNIVWKRPKKDNHTPPALSNNKTSEAVAGGDNTPY
ncbi:MAG: DUF736 family protein [Alphaproteobacteria bacterium]|jgi:uncharacterized protein (DUF736 family)